MKMEMSQLAPMIKQLYSEHTQQKDIVGILIPDNLLTYLIGNQDDPPVPMDKLLSESDFEELIFCLFHNRVDDNLQYEPEDPEDPQDEDEALFLDEEETIDEDFYEFLSLVIYKLSDSSVVVVDRSNERSGNIYEVTLLDIESLIEQFEG